MKRLLLAISTIAVLQTQGLLCYSAESETRPSASILEEAQSLAQIYVKLRLLSSFMEGPELNDSLEALNQGLDHVLAFRDSFTPEKRKKIEGQLKNLQKESKKILGRNRADLEKDLPKLADQILQLVKTLTQ